MGATGGQRLDRKEQLAVLTNGVDERADVRRETDGLDAGTVGVVNDEPLCTVDVAAMKLDLLVREGEPLGREHETVDGGFVNPRDQVIARFLELRSQNLQRFLDLHLECLMRLDTAEETFADSALVLRGEPLGGGEALFDHDAPITAPIRQAWLFMHDQALEPPLDPTRAE